MQMKKSPTPEQIRAARGSRTQKKSAELIGMSVRSWQNWEAPIGTKEHRNMKAGMLELFKLKRDIEDGLK